MILNSGKGGDWRAKLFKELARINIEISLFHLAHSSERKQTSSHNTTKQSDTYQDPISHAGDIKLGSKHNQ